MAGKGKSDRKADSAAGKGERIASTSAAQHEGVEALKARETGTVSLGGEGGAVEGLGVGVVPTKKPAPGLVINGDDIPAPALPPGLLKRVTGRMGQPYEYDRQATMDAICEILATSPKSLTSICKLEGAPTVTTVMEWLEQSPDLAEQYTRARLAQADFLASAVPEVALTPLAAVRKKMKRDEEGKVSYEEIEVDNVERSRLIADAYKWYAGKLAPKKYGDKVADVTVNAAVSVQGLLATIGGDNRSLLPDKEE